ncbi:hypothetical protein BG011_001109 [Mortierella polycephala]|uniref:Thiamine pyrophosphokinase n=1 Tax=Mortierella polycephala TaxID=41804 RepID=A0A9P6Q608_9FUNG|nr:hypothetical protein BG011_001109 [Mortierella polycephala]
MNWQPSKCLENPEEYRSKCISKETGQEEFALIILNQPIRIKRRLFDNVWQNAKYRFCADGGANRLYDLLDTDEERTKYLPDYIRGDLDSLRDIVKDYYLAKGVPVERVSDQDSTDFMKCVDLVRDRDPQLESSASTSSPDLADSSVPRDEVQKTGKGNYGSKLGIVALGGIGGRFDQSMSSIHYLYILNRERQAVLVSNESIVVVLTSGIHEITCNLEIEGPSCGVIPVGSSEATLTLTGLKWDVENWKTSFGGQISTSNVLIGSKVVVQTDAPVVWTTELVSK